MGGSRRMSPRTCRARLEFGDDYGDNTCTFKCQRESGHAGDHRESGAQTGFTAGGYAYEIPYSVIWPRRDEQLGNRARKSVKQIQERG